MGSAAPHSCSLVRRGLSASGCSPTARSTARSSFAVTSASASVPASCSCGTLCALPNAPVLRAVQTSPPPSAGAYFAALFASQRSGPQRTSAASKSEGITPAGASNASE